MNNIDLNNKNILVTGAAGFIGSDLAKRLCSEYPMSKVIGIDNMNSYYDVSLKEYRLNELSVYSNFEFIKGNIADKECIVDIFNKYMVVFV